MFKPVLSLVFYLFLISLFVVKVGHIFFKKTREKENSTPGIKPDIFTSTMEMIIKFYYFEGFATLHKNRMERRTEVATTCLDLLGVDIPSGQWEHRWLFCELRVSSEVTCGLPSDLWWDLWWQLLEAESGAVDTLNTQDCTAGKADWRKWRNDCADEPEIVMCLPKRTWKRGTWLIHFNHLVVHLCIKTRACISVIIQINIYTHSQSLTHSFHLNGGENSDWYHVTLRVVESVLCSSQKWIVFQTIFCILHNVWKFNQCRSMCFL